MSAVIGSKSAAAMVTLAIVAAILGVFIVSDVATRNGHTTARNQDAATETIRIRIRCVARDDTTGEIQLGTRSINTATRSGLIRCNHAAGHVDRDFRAHYAQATAPAATLLIKIRAGNKTAIDIHLSFVTVPHGKDDMTVAGQIPRCRDHAPVEVKRTAIRNRNDSFDRTAFGCSNDCAETADGMLFRGFSGAKAICVRRARGFIIG